MNSHRRRYSEFVEVGVCIDCGKPVDLHTVMITSQTKRCIDCYRAQQKLREAL
jgi:RNA polymerase-binding transcription factor DksA